MIPFLFITALLVASVGAYAFRSIISVLRFSLGSSIVIGGAMLLLSTLALVNPEAFTLSGFWHTDGLSSLLIALVSFLYVTATFVSYRYVGQEHAEGVLSASQVRLYALLVPIFILTMLLSLISDNLGVLWIGLEGTTLATTMLVAMYRKDASIEAAWKYIILCSIGISLGLLGMLLFVYAGVHGAGLEPFQALSLRALSANTSSFDPALVSWAFAFVFVGLGTKVGFVPMHTWLPDAHSKTPSPVSALLSGVLLNVALYAILRFKALADLSFGSSLLTDRFFLTFGILSVTIAALILLQQRNYKRMLAYSSIEHMGLMALLIGLGPVGVTAAILHTVSHALIKSMLFFGAGEVFLTYHTTKIEQVKALSTRLPKTWILFLLGLLVILAVPPSGLFVSELSLIGLLIFSYPWLSALLIVDLSMIAWSMLSSLLAMCETSEERQIKKPESWKWTHTMMTMHLLLALFIGLTALSTDGMQFFFTIAQSL